MRLSSHRRAHLEQSSTIRKSIAVSADFLEEIEDWTVLEIVYNQQFSATQLFCNMTSSVFYLRHDNGTSFTN